MTCTEDGEVNVSATQLQRAVEGMYSHILSLFGSLPKQVTHLHVKPLEEVVRNVQSGTNNPGLSTVFYVLLSTQFLKWKLHVQC